MINPHIHIPFERIDTYLDYILRYQINIELFFKGEVLDNTSEKDIKKVRELLPYNPSLTVHGPFADLSPGATDSKIRKVTIDRFSQTIEYASILNAKIVVFHSGYEKWKYALDVDLWLEKSIETWKPINKLAKERGVKIAIENIFEEEPSNLRLLMEEMASENFGVCFDSGHFNIFSNTPLTLWIDA
ncbi:MAG: sugar phosphate isomerase/epimerase family protein, partial [Thermodesulfovibrionales bacterium]